MYLIKKRTERQERNYLFILLFVLDKVQDEKLRWLGLVLQSGGSADIGEKDADRGCQAGGKVEDFRED